MVALVQPHLCPGLHSILHGYVNIEMKQINKQNSYMWILSPYLFTFFDMYVISPQIYTKCHVFGLINLYLFFPIPFLIDLQGYP
jgi:hypothetical protein